MIRAGNLFTDVASKLAEEEFTILFDQPAVRVERIVSTGQASPLRQWYDQDWTEWVLLVSGSAGLLIEGEDAPRTLRSGDWLELPARVRHRVEWTDADKPTVWLAVHVTR